jgi:beta-galactosidase
MRIQVMWDGWVDVEKPRTHIIRSLELRRGTMKNVYVVSSGEKVELFINGVSKGFGEQSNRFLFTFKSVTWQSGNVRAVAYDKTGRMVSDDTKKTAGNPAAVLLTPILGPKGLQANGDMALIEVEVVDARGNRCPTALNMIDFSLSGPAEWRGGIAQGPDNYILSKSLPVEGGVIESDSHSSTAGRITIKQQLRSKGTSLTLTSHPVTTIHGLLPEDRVSSLPVSLKRGPYARK